MTDGELWRVRLIGRMANCATNTRTNALKALMRIKKLYLACTVETHLRLGVHAPINARAGEHWRNWESQEETERKRDARKIRERITARVRFYQFNSKFFRRHQERFTHLISTHDEH